MRLKQCFSEYRMIICYQIVFITNIGSILPLNKQARYLRAFTILLPNSAQHLLVLGSHLAPVAFGIFCLACLAQFCSVSVLSIFSCFPPFTSPSSKLHSGYVSYIKRKGF